MKATLLPALKHALAGCATQSKLLVFWEVRSSILVFVHDAADGHGGSAAAGIGSCTGGLRDAALAAAGVPPAPKWLRGAAVPARQPAGRACHALEADRIARLLRLGIVNTNVNTHVFMRSAGRMSVRCPAVTGKMSGSSSALQRQPAS